MKNYKVLEYLHIKYEDIYAFRWQVERLYHSNGTLNNTRIKFMIYKKAPYDSVDFYELEFLFKGKSKLNIVYIERRMFSDRNERGTYTKDETLERTRVELETPEQKKKGKLFLKELSEILENIRKSFKPYSSHNQYDYEFEHYFLDDEKYKITDEISGTLGKTFRFYFIYLKAKGMSRYKPTDINKGTVVNSILYATMFDTLEDAQYALKLLKSRNPNIDFKVVGND